MTIPFRSLKFAGLISLATAIVVACASIWWLTAAPKVDPFLSARAAPPRPVGLAAKQEKDDAHEPAKSYRYLRKMPAHATLYKEKLYGFFEPGDGEFIISAIGTKKPSFEGRGRYSNGWASGSVFHLRHHVGFGCLWRSTCHLDLFQFKMDELPLFDVENPNREKQYTAKYLGLEIPFRESRDALWLGSLYSKYEGIAYKGTGGSGWETPAEAVAGIGVVPTSINSCKSFILTRATKQFETWDSAYIWNDANKYWKPKPSARFAKMDKWVKDLDSSNFQTRAHATAELEQQRWLAKPALEQLLKSSPTNETRLRAEQILRKLPSEGRRFGLQEEADNYEAFPSLFAEEFYVFLHKDDYYFVTESGKLYVAPPAAKGEKARTMKPLWTDAKRPISAVIHDADKDKYWLFAKDNNPGAKLDHFFEMNDTPRPETFDPAKLRPIDVEGHAKLLLQYVPLISPVEKK